MSDLVADERTLGIIKGAASMFATQAEIGDLLNVSVWQFTRFIAADREARLAYDSGVAQAKLRLRKLQWAHAEKNHGMAIFLGKNYLGQRDIPGDGADVAPKPAPANDALALDSLTVEELAELERITAKARKSKPRRDTDGPGEEEPAGVRSPRVA